MSLREKVVVIVGGGRGLGRAYALACAAQGARVVVADLGCSAEGDGRDPSVAESVAHAIEAHGGQASALCEDIGELGAADRIVEHARSRFGRLDGLVASAGLAFDRSVLKTEAAELDRALDVIVRGSFALVRAGARAMMETGGGAIVLHAAPVALFGAIRQSVMAGASGAVLGLTRSAAIELRKHRVRVNAVAPTARTRLTEHLPLFQGIAPSSMTPEQVAPVVVFLLSDLATEVTGEIVGAAGNRIYALRARETPGSFGDVEWTAERIAAAWTDITRQ
ncbi:MAG: SDR family oxidoreductase [Sandaracinaceae bacterium]|nr:SDR family oxidoreductase [Sandaracinaceae bacterium]